MNLKDEYALAWKLDLKAITQKKLYKGAWDAKEAAKKAMASKKLIAGHLKSASEKICELQETVGELKGNLLTAIRTPHMITVRTKDKGRP